MHVDSCIWNGWGRKSIALRSLIPSVRSRYFSAIFMSVYDNMKKKMEEE